MSISYGVEGDGQLQVRDESNSPIDEVKRIRGQLSLKLLRTIDKNVQSIIYQTPFVTAYEMKSDDRWSRADIEGFLYIVHRSMEPTNSFVIINKRSENHLVEYITPEFEMDIDENFIFYRSFNVTTKCINVLRGLWFFDESECRKTFESIKGIMDSCLLSLEDSASKSLCYGRSPRQSRSVIAATPQQPSIHPSKVPVPSTLEKFGGRRQSVSVNSDSLSTSFNVGKTAVPGNRNSDITTGPIGRESNSVSSSNRNTEVQRLFNLLQSCSRPTNNFEHHGDSYSAAAPPAFQVKRNNFLQRDSKMNVDYEMLKTAIVDAAQNDQFIALVWDRLRNISSRIDFPD